MIHAEFYKHGNAYVGFQVSGHAGYAEYGQDIVCAGVSSALEMTVNGICEILRVDARTEVLENEIRFLLSDDKSEGAQSFLKAFRLHLVNLSEDYQNTIQLTDVEV
jgi:uncharacterized protein YsxB (DUF464 family)